MHFLVMTSGVYFFLYSCNVGRPKSEVDITEVLSLRSLRYSWTKISELVGVSRSTLYRRLNKAGIPTDDYTQITDHDLDEAVKGIKCNFPGDGEVMLASHLLRVGIKVPRQHLRDCIHRVDHENTVARRSSVVKRRVYSVDQPNSMRHLDSHHKLIKWRFITHAGIDGFSRTITNITCANNNKSETVLQQFLIGTDEFGLPFHVRTDHGGENIKVWEYMLISYNNDPSRVITGSSTHNERIERLWRDVHRSVTSNFADAFRSLEREKMLDPLNEVNLFCLHYVYMPRICEALTEFQQCWNNHKLSTEGHKTPLQLFYEGLTYVSQASEDSVVTSSNPTATSVLEIVSNQEISVPCNSYKPCSILLTQLQSVNVMTKSSSFGKDIYYSVVRICGSHLQQGCTVCMFQ